MTLSHKLMRFGGISGNTCRDRPTRLRTGAHCRAAVLEEVPGHAEITDSAAPEAQQEGGRGRPAESRRPTVPRSGRTPGTGGSSSACAPPATTTPTSPSVPLKPCPTRTDSPGGRCREPARHGSVAPALIRGLFPEWLPGLFRQGGAGISHIVPVLPDGSVGHGHQGRIESCLPPHRRTELRRRSHNRPGAPRDRGRG